MKTILIEAPEWFDLNTCMINIEFYNEERFEEFDHTDKRVREIHIPTDMDINEWIEQRIKMIDGWIS